MTINFDVSLIYILILILVCLILLSIVLLALYLRSLDKYVKLRTAGKSENDDTVIDNAQKVAAEIIKKAESESRKIVETSKTASGKYDQIVDSAIKGIIASWDNKSSEVFDRNILLLDSQLKNLIKDIYDKENKNLETYKNQRLSQIDKEVQDLVNKISKKIIFREIGLEDHKKFILASLEAAKKDGQFN